MRRFATTMVLAVLAFSFAGGTPAIAQTLLFDYVGFDYESPNPNPSTFGEAGSGYRSIGTAENIFSPLTADFANNQYTYDITGLSVVSSNVVGDFLIVNYSAGTLSLYEDSKTTGTPAAFGVNPPNGTAPGNFIDGTLILSGPLTSFQFVLNTTSNSGSFESAFEATGGSQLANIPVDQRTGWTFSGATGNASNIPVGYEHQIDGQVLLEKPTPVELSSWGRLKAIYR